MKRLLFASLIVLALTACNSNTSAPTNPADAVQEYLRAKVNADADALRSLLCAAQEPNLDREAKSYKGAKAELRNTACTQNAGGNPVTVTCSGTIEVNYGAEQLSFPLTKYKVVQEDGRWKWCGEAP